MRTNRLLLAVTLLIMVTASCTSYTPELKGINLDEWKSDPNGCHGIRMTMKDAIDSQKEQLLRLDELQITETLGKPDEHELYKRNQKFYHYYISAGPACKMSENRPIRLTIRFNAMGLAKEVILE